MAKVAVSKERVELNIGPNVVELRYIYSSWILGIK